MRKLQLESKEIEGRAVIFLHGYLNQSGGEMLALECENLFARGIRILQLDFAGASLVNSIGISFLLDIIEHAQRETKELEFSRVPGHILELFDLLGICSRIPMRQL